MKLAAVVLRFNEIQPFPVFVYHNSKSEAPRVSDTKARYVSCPPKVVAQRQVIPRNYAILILELLKYAITLDDIVCNALLLTLAPPQHASE